MTALDVTSSLNSMGRTTVARATADMRTKTAHAAAKRIQRV